MPTETIERVTDKGGKRHYKNPKKDPLSITPLLPVALDALRLMFKPAGEKSPSVTTILNVINKPALIGWSQREERKQVSVAAAYLYESLPSITSEPVTRDKFIELLNDVLGKGAHLKLLAKAANVGTQVHARIEWELKGELALERESTAPKLMSDQANRSFEKWSDWRAQVNLEPLTIEQRLFSNLYDFGGTSDLVANVNGVKALLDWKTGKAVYAESFLQNIAYRMAFQEEGITIGEGWIIRLPKYEDDPDFEAVKVPNDPTLGPVFLACKLVYDWVERNHKPKPKQQQKAAA